MIKQIISRRPESPCRRCRVPYACCATVRRSPSSAATARRRPARSTKCRWAPSRSSWNASLNLESRRQTILTTIEEQGEFDSGAPPAHRGVLGPGGAGGPLPALKPKRRTRATVARERGLEPLADLVMAQRARDAAQQARRYVSAEVPTPKTPSPGRATSSPNASRERTGPQRPAPHLRPRGRRAHEGREGQGGRRSQIFRLFRRRDAAAQHLVAPVSGHAPRSRRRRAEDHDRHRRRPLHRGLCRQFIRPGSATRARGWRPQPRDSFKRSCAPSIETEQLAAAKGKGRRRSHPGLRREPAATAAFAAAGTEARDRPRPRIPHGLQGRGARFAGRPAPQHDRLSPCAAEPLCRGRRNP